MTQVQFVRDYRGKLTKEQFYQAGAVAEVDDATAAELVERQAVVILTRTVAPVLKAKR